MVTTLSEIYMILKVRERQPILTFSIATIIILVFVLQQANVVLKEDYGFIPEQALNRPWIFITSIFLHSGFVHLFYNLLALFYEGFYLECATRIKRGYLLVVFLLAGIAGAFPCMILGWKGIGASGATSGLLGVLIALEPTDFSTVIVSGEDFLIIGVGWMLIGFPLLGLSHIVHVAGLVVGVLLGIYWKKCKSQGFT
jgi:membrane associated rhomboid family serine protease